MRAILQIAGILAAVTPAVTAQEPISTSVAELLAKPAKFHSKRVSVVGYFWTGTHETVLLIDGAPKRFRDLEHNSIWLYCPWAHVDPARRLPASRNFVRVVGTFQHTPERYTVEHNDTQGTATFTPGSGHSGRWPSQITAITEFQLQPKKKRR